MASILHIKIYVQAAFCEQAHLFNLHIYFCMAELLRKIQNELGNNLTNEEIKEGYRLAYEVTIFS